VNPTEHGSRPHSTADGHEPPHPTAVLAHSSRTSVDTFIPVGRPLARVQRQQVLVVVVAAAALLSFGVAADGLDTPPPVAQSPEQTGDQESLRDLPELWEFPACDPCEVDTQPLISSAAGNIPPVVLAGLAALGALAVGGAYLSAGGGDETLGPAPTDEERSIDVSTDTGASQSPPEAPSPPPSNDVYRAWRALADRVGPDRARTAGEYADAALAQGADEDAVRTLTALFRRVRYGGAEPTERLEARARRARDALDGADDSRATDGADESTGVGQS